MGRIVTALLLSIISSSIWFRLAEAKDTRPKLLLIVADDLGNSDILRL